MHFKDRLSRFRQEAIDAGVPKPLVGTLPYELLWLFGVPVKPAVCQGFIARAVTVGSFCGPLFGVLMAIVPEKAMSIPAAIGAGLAFGGFMGIFWAGMISLLSIGRDVPKWDDLDSQ